VLNVAEDTIFHPTFKIRLSIYSELLWAHRKSNYFESNPISKGLGVEIRDGGNGIESLYNLRRLMLVFVLATSTSYFLRYWNCNENRAVPRATSKWWPNRKNSLIL